MKDDIPPFSGFSKKVFQFFKDLSKNNNTAWFTNNRSRYQQDVVLPARSFVTDIGQFFNRLNPAIRTAPKFNETLMRINKDMRFAKGEPYRNYFLIHFGRFKMDTEFYVYFDQENLQYGLFINNSGDSKDLYFGRNIQKFRKEFIKYAETYDINNNYEFYEMKKDFSLIDPQFHSERYYEKLMTTKMMLLQKSLPGTDKRIFSPDILIEMIQTFTALYPIYCFSATSQPLKLIAEFEDNFGMVQI